MKIVQRLLLNLLLSIASLTLMVNIYLGKIVSQFNFGGFSERNEQYLTFGIFLVLAMVVFSTLVRSKVYELYAAIKICFLIQPSMVLMSYGGQNPEFFLMITISLFIVGMFFLSLRLARGAASNKKIINFNERIFWWAPLGITSGILLMTALNFNLTMSFDLDKIYDYRFDINESTGFPLNYLLPFAAGPMLSYLAVISVSAMKYWRTILVFILGIFFYGLTTHKSYMFTPIFAVLIYYFLRTRIGVQAMLQILIASLLLVINTIDVPMVDYITGMFANRVVFLPSLITYTYFEEFSKIGYMYWAESKIGLGLVPSILPNYSVNYIGEIMTGDAKNVANVGWVATSYMNLGGYGLVLYGAMVALLLRVIDDWNNQWGGSVIISTFAISFFNIILSIDLFVSMMSTGLLLMMILIYIVLHLGRARNRNWCI